MSSGVDSEGIIAAAVLLPLGAALGAGWLAWQAGKLLVGANSAADDMIAKKKQRLEEEAMHRKHSALAAHSQLVDMCKQLLSKIDGNSAAQDQIDHEELEQLRAELMSICAEAVPDDVIKLESMNSLGFMKLDRMTERQKFLAGLQMEAASAGIYRGLPLAELMRDVKIAITAMEIRATDGKDVRAADPAVLERVKLSERLSDVTARITEALMHTAELSNVYGLSAANSAWFHSCFNGVDEQIEVLYMPSTTNEELKRGIKRLEAQLEQYDMLIPTIDSDRKKLAALYRVYVDASKALGEPIADIKSFKNADALEKRLNELKERSKRAQECAEIYQKLGASAYICYAWDQELLALGYSVHKRRDIEEMAKHKPENARLGESKLPFYHWNDDELTQLYSMSSDCSLQLIVHDDGAVTMQTIADADGDKAKATQATHCSLLGKLHENLRKNWFVIYDYQETASPDELTTSTEWFGSEDSSWKPDRSDTVTVHRRKDKSETQAKKLQ